MSLRRLDQLSRVDTRHLPHVNRATGVVHVQEPVQLELVQAQEAALLLRSAAAGDARRSAHPAPVESVTEDALAVRRRRDMPQGQGRRHGRSLADQLPARSVSWCSRFVGGFAVRRRWCDSAGRASHTATDTQAATPPSSAQVRLDASNVGTTQRSPPLSWHTRSGRLPTSPSTDRARLVSRTSPAAARAATSARRPLVVTDEG